MKLFFRISNIYFYRKMYSYMSYAIKKNERDILKSKRINGSNSIYFLAVTFMLYGLNPYLNLILLPLIFGIFFININNSIFYFYYFALIIFEPVLVLPFGLGSVFRIYQLLFIIKIIIDYKNRKNFRIPLMHKQVLAIILIIWSVTVNQSISFIFSMTVNLFIILYIFSYISSNKQKEENYSYMLFTIFLFALLAACYGLYNINKIFHLENYRFGSTIGDPNYTALFYLLGIFSLLGTKVINSFRMKLLLFLVMCFFLILTVSLTGIAGFSVLLIMYFLIKDKKIALLILLLIILFTGCLYYLPFETGVLYLPKTRLLVSVKYFLDGNYLRLTSGRTALYNNYLSHFLAQPFAAILFGGQHIIGGNTRAFMLNLFDRVSHNSYIDMLYAVGVIGTIFILGCFLYDIIQNLINYKTSKEELYLSIAFLKLTILWFSITISIFPYRYFLMCMFL